MAIINFKNVFKVYPGDVQAVNDFNLEIADKEFIVLVGPSGCGKTTTLRMLAGLEEITAGEVFIGERKINDVAPKDRDIAMVFQNYALYPHMTVFKNMAFSLKLRKMPKKEIKEKVESVAKILGIEHLLNRKPKALSGGQRQRVALGRAMVREPAAFLLDEPLSNLDAKLRTTMRAEISKLHKQLGTTFVYVTHDQIEATTMGDRIVVMRDGFIQQVDTPQNLYDSPCNLFVAGFIGSPQMNFIPAEVKEETGKYMAVFGVFKAELPGSKAELLAKYVGKPVILGVRPEGFSESEVAGVNIIEGKVDLAERMGAEKYIYLTCEDTKITARLPAHSTADYGNQVKLLIDSKAIHIFDKETELAI